MTSRAARIKWDALSPEEKSAMRGAMARDEFSTRSQFLHFLDAVEELGQFDAETTERIHRAKAALER